MLHFLRSHYLRLILLLGLLNGLLFVFLVPPWEHYDEPGHFEYAWLVANHPGMPKPGDYDQAMRLDMAISMIDHNFFHDRGFPPDLTGETGPAWNGISQLDDPPLYYLLFFLPLRLTSSLNITDQLYVGRMVSLCLYLVTILAAWGIMKELVPEGNPLRWMVPVSLALLPGYVDIMTSINNDVGATAAFCLFLWGSVTMVKKGFSFPRFLWMGGTAVASYLMKNTAAIALPLSGLVLLFSLLRGRRLWIAWSLLILGMLLIPMITFSWGDASSWIRAPNTFQKSPTRSLSPDAPLGRYVMQLHSADNDSAYDVFQALPTIESSALRGKTVTLGAWIWATRPLTDNVLFLYDGKYERQSYFTQKMSIGISPTFYAMTVTLDDDAGPIQLILTHSGYKDIGDFTFYFDGLVLVEGAQPLDQVPHFDDASGRQGVWGGQAFTNLVRNASFENVGLAVQPWAQKIVNKLSVSTMPPSIVLGSLLDWKANGSFFILTIKILLQTFWAKFGWGQILLSLPFIKRPYLLLEFVTLIGLVGAAAFLYRRRKSLPWPILFIFGLALAGIWGQAFLRGILSVTPLVPPLIFTVPVARYASPAIILTLLVLNSGWLEIGHYLYRWVRLPAYIMSTTYFLFFLGLDAAALLTIAHLYS